MIAEVANREASRPPWLPQINKTSAIALVAFLVGVVAMIARHPFSLAERGDLAIWDYISQSILRGQIPYRDVIEIKSPLSAYLSAAFIALGRLIGLQDVFAVRILQVLLVGALSTLTYLVAEAYLQSRSASVISFLVPLLPEHLTTMIAGTQPKLTMILFGLLTLLFIARHQPFCAGIASMLSFLSWQPGLLFTGVALLVFSNFFTSWRDLRALKTLLGSAIPLVILISYFYLAGALGDLWRWTIAFNLQVYAPREVKGLRESATLIWRITRQAFRSNIVFVVLSAFGLATSIFRLFLSSVRREKPKPGPETIRLVALTAPPIIYLAFCLINFQGSPDLIPLFPFIGIFTGCLVVEVARFIAARLTGRINFSLNLGRLVPTIAMVLIALLLVVHLRYNAESGQTLEDQNKAFQVVAGVLEPDDKIYVHGTLELLVLLKKQNITPYIMFDEGKDDYIAQEKYGGSFQKILDELEVNAPKIISLSRLRRVSHGAAFERWVLERYRELPVSGYDAIYVRKE
jgi:hypothetical protein